MDFLSPSNQCGQNALRITSRGSAIIAELLRLSANIPEIFLGSESRIRDPDQCRYLPILFDFQYLRNPDDCERKINENSELLDLNVEFQENHYDILERFYHLFESILRYYQDMMKYIEDVEAGYYIQHSLDSICEEIEGRQLLCELLYLYGMMLLLLEEKLPGPVRERLLIAQYRIHGEAGLPNIEDICKLCRSTGFLPSWFTMSDVKRPKNYPENFFGRFAPPVSLVRQVLQRLQMDDIYLMSPAFPSPEHRSTRLATQAAMLYVTLYFAPDLLHKSKATMREVVDKYFNDNWVIATYMGSVVDLTVEWSCYPAAKSALDNVLSTSSVKALDDANSKGIQQCLKNLKSFLKEGVLQQDYLLDNIQPLLNCVRECNVVLRWRLMHRNTKFDAFRKIIENSVDSQTIVALLLNTSQLEYILKGMLQTLLADKDLAWTEGKTNAAERMKELSEVFGGDRALSRVKRDESLMKWFANLADQVNALNLEESHATATGRKIQSLIAALEDVEQFEAVDTNIQITSFLQEVREIFRTMIRTVNVKAEILSTMETVGDLSYAWQILGDYVRNFHERISKDPAAVVLLRATFLKTASILDVPLVRIASIDSPDAVSVAAYYSGELVEFVRVVLEVIPVSVFRALAAIVEIQTSKLKAIPMRFEAKDLKEYAQPEIRCELSRLTHQVSVFTEGILVMEKTLLGVIQVEPRQILEEGLRRELVRLISHALHKKLTFRDPSSPSEVLKQLTSVSSTLGSLRHSIEYLQDYIAIAGLKIYQQEFSRVISYFTEQEANRFVKKKTFDTASRFQSREIPIPRLLSAGTVSVGNEAEGVSVTFMGRVLQSLLALTDPATTIYAPEWSAWFVFAAPDQKPFPTVEKCSGRTFMALENSLGVIGLRGLDRLLAFRAVHTLNAFQRFYKRDVNPFRTMLDQVRTLLHPVSGLPSSGPKGYLNLTKKVEGLMLPMLKHILSLGQSQLLRRQISNLLQHGCQLEAQILYQTLDTFNSSLLNDVRRHYADPSNPMPSEESPLLSETTALLEACGLDNPMHKVYITTDPLEGLPVLLFLFLITYIPKLDYDPNFASLIRKRSKLSLDGAPLAVGVACLLRQFHPGFTRQVLAYLGQFVRCHLFAVFSESENKTIEVPRELLNTLVFMEQLCLHSSISRTAVHEFVPPYIFDTMKFSSIPKK